MITLQLRPPVQTIRRTTDGDDITANTTLATDAVLSITVPAGKSFMLDAFIAHSGGQTGDIKFGWTAPANATLLWTSGGLASGATSVASSVRLPLLALADSDTLGAIGITTPTVAMIRGLLTTTDTGGAFALQVAQGTSDAAVSKLRAGSWVRLEEIS